MLRIGLLLEAFSFHSQNMGMVGDCAGGECCVVRNLQLLLLPCDLVCAEEWLSLHLHILENPARVCAEGIRH